MPDHRYGATVDSRLAVYGTLAPGQSNHHVIAAVGGEWLDGTVHGHLRAGGWGSALGFPGLVPDPGAPAIPVRLLVSEALPSHLPRLDAFEGDGYERVRVEVWLRDGTTEAWIYALRERRD